MNQSLKWLCGGCGCAARFWVILVEILLLVQKQLVFACKCCNRSKWVLTQFFHNLAKSVQISVFELFLPYILQFVLKHIILKANVVTGQK